MDSADSRTGLNKVWFGFFSAALLVTMLFFPGVDVLLEHFLPALAAYILVVYWAYCLIYKESAFAFGVSARFFGKYGWLNRAIIVLGVVLMLLVIFNL